MHRLLRAIVSGCAFWRALIFGLVALGEVANAVAQGEVAAMVRHAPQLNSGRVEGSVWQLTGEDVTLNGGVVVTGDLLVPGTPTLRLHGQPALLGTVPGAGPAPPSNYRVTLNGDVSLGWLRTRTPPEALPNVLPPATTAGTRDVTLSGATGSYGDAATLRDLQLHGGAGFQVVPPGAYRDFTASAGSGFILGVVGALTPNVTKIWI